MDILITPRLTIRPPLDVDGDALVTHLNDPKVTCNLRPLPKPYRQEDAKTFLQGVAESQTQRGFVLVRERAIGMIGLSDYNAESKTAHLGYWLATRHHGKGLMTEALNKVVGQLFGEGWVTSIQSNVLESNQASQNVQRKLGFEFTGRRHSQELNGTLLDTKLSADDYHLIH